MMCVSMLSCFSYVQFFATLWTVAHQAPLFMGFSRKEYWNGLPCPPSGDLSYSVIKPVPLLSPALAGGFFTISAMGIPYNSIDRIIKQLPIQIPQVLIFCHNCVVSIH